MQKKDFTQYKTKEDFLKDFEIKNGILDLSNQQINDDDLKHILELIGEEPSLEILYLYNTQLTTLPESLKSILPHCKIVKDNKCIFVDDLINSLNAKVQDIDNKIAKLQYDKENIQNTIKIMENN